MSDLSEEIARYKKVIEPNIASIGLVDMWIVKIQSLEKENEYLKKFALDIIYAEGCTGNISKEDWELLKQSK